MSEMHLEKASAVSAEGMVYTPEKELVELSTSRHTTVEDVIDEVYVFFQENDTGYDCEQDAVCKELEASIEHYAVEYDPINPDTESA